MTKKIKEIIRPVVEKEGFLLKDAYFAREMGKKAVIAVIDSKKGVTAADCARISRLIDPLLEESGIFNGEFLLIVSSPGEEAGKAFL